MTDTEEIRLLIDRRIDALGNHDAQAANQCLARDIVAYEVAGPLQVPSEHVTDVGIAQSWMDSFEEGPWITVQDLVIHVEGSIAFAHSIQRLKGIGSDKSQIDLSMRSTMGFAKRENGWMIVHSHTSSPVKF